MPTEAANAGHPTRLNLAPEPLSDAMRAYFDKCVEKVGFVPNVLGAYSHDLGKLEAFVAMADGLMLAPSGLSKLEREMIAVVVSATNRCHYCVVSHGAAVRKLSADAILGDTLAVNYRAATLSPRQRAMLDFAWTLTVEPWTIGDAHRQALRDAGFAERDIFDIAAVAGFFNMSNRLAGAVAMDPNRDYYAMAR